MRSIDHHHRQRHSRIVRLCPHGYRWPWRSRGRSRRGPVLVRQRRIVRAGHGWQLTRDDVDNGGTGWLTAISVAAGFMASTFFARGRPSSSCVVLVATVVLGNHRVGLRRPPLGETVTGSQCVRFPILAHGHVGASPGNLPLTEERGRVSAGLPPRRTGIIRQLALIVGIVTLHLAMPQVHRQTTLTPPDRQIPR